MLIFKHKTKISFLGRRNPSLNWSIMHNDLKIYADIRLTERMSVQ